jgi:hypothetical protein
MGAFNRISLGLEKNDDQLRDEYFIWLCNIIGVNVEKESYSILAKRLHGIEYFWFVPNDDNRGEDGLKLRRTFIEVHELGPYEQFILDAGPCSVLEMLVAMSIKMAELMEQVVDNNEPGDWFWELIKNAGLDTFSDFQYHFVGGHMAVAMKVHKILERDYERNGVGGFFPLQETDVDQRKVELWYQMNAYLGERYCYEC